MIMCVWAPACFLPACFACLRFWLLGVFACLRFFGAQLQHTSPWWALARRRASPCPPANQDAALPFGCVGLDPSGFINAADFADALSGRALERQQLKQQRKLQYF
jgi:hypothetical protein